MSTPIPEQLTIAQKAGLDACRDLASSVFDSMRKLTELNLRTASSQKIKNC
jgi:hypothetical protein